MNLFKRFIVPLFILVLLSTGISFLLQHQKVAQAAGCSQPPVLTAVQATRIPYTMYVVYTRKIKNPNSVNCTYVFGETKVSLNGNSRQVRVGDWSNPQNTSTHDAWVVRYEADSQKVEANSSAEVKVRLEQDKNTVPGQRYDVVFSVELSSNSSIKDKYNTYYAADAPTPTPAPTRTPTPTPTPTPVPNCNATPINCTGWTALQSNTCSGNNAKRTCTYSTYNGSGTCNRVQYDEYSTQNFCNAGNQCVNGSCQGSSTPTPTPTPRPSTSSSPTPTPSGSRPICNKIDVNYAGRCNTQTNKCRYTLYETGGRVTDACDDVDSTISCTTASDCPPQNQVQLDFVLGLDGIGATGDFSNRAQIFGTNDPNYNVTNAQVCLYPNGQNDSGFCDHPYPLTLNYNGSTKLWIGSLALGGAVAPGNYSIKIRAQKYLIRKIGSDMSPAQQTWTLVAGNNQIGTTANQSSHSNLMVGDIDGTDFGNNNLTSVDWSIIKDCLDPHLFSAVTAGHCTSSAKADLNADGLVNENDLNYFIRERPSGD